MANISTVYNGKKIVNQTLSADAFNIKDIPEKYETAETLNNIKLTLCHVPQPESCRHDHRACTEILDCIQGLGCQRVLENPHEIR